MGVILRESCPICGRREPDILARCNTTGQALVTEICTNHNARSSRTREVVGTHFRDGSFDYRRCPECGLVWQGWILDSAGMDDFYGAGAYDKGDEHDVQRYLLTHPYQSGERLARKVMEALTLMDTAIPQLRTLDFGCGWGRWMAMASAMGARTAGVELSQKKRDFCRAQGLEVCPSLDDVAGEFDVINCDQVLEHVAEPLALTTSLALRLKSGGVMRLSVPNGRGCAARLKRKGLRCSNSAAAPFAHINTFSNANLKRLAREAGLTPVLPSAKYGPRKGFLGHFQNVVNNWYEYYAKTTIYARLP